MIPPSVRPLPRYRRGLSFIVLVLLGAFVGGCSIFSSLQEDSRYSELSGGTASEVTEGTEVAVERIDPSAQNASGRLGRTESRFIEVLWEVPALPVQGFILRYGTDESALSGSVQLMPEKLQRVRASGGAELYRYLLPEPARDKTVYITIAAVDGAVESAPTKALAVPPEEAAPQVRP